MERWLELIFDIESKQEGLMKTITYIFRECGGLLWPILYGIMLGLTWVRWTTATQVGLTLAGVLLTIVAILYPRTWKHWAKKIKGPVGVIESSYLSLTEDFFKAEQLNVWQRAREKGIEAEVTKEVVNIRKAIDDLYERLKHA